MKDNSNHQQNLCMVALFFDSGGLGTSSYGVSTRQSGFITKVEQLELKEGRNDSDRGISEMNYALVKEVEIAGVQIWKAI